MARKTSKHLGVGWVAAAGKWRAQKVIKGKHFNLGLTELEEASARRVQLFMENLELIQEHLKKPVFVSTKTELTGKPSKGFINPSIYNEEIAKKCSVKINDGAYTSSSVYASPEPKAFR
jgi:hypothetical protein